MADGRARPLLVVAIETQPQRAVPRIRHTASPQSAAFYWFKNICSAAKVCACNSELCVSKGKLGATVVSTDLFLYVFTYFFL